MIKIYALPRTKFSQLLDVLTDEEKQQSAFISINETDPLFVEFQPTSDNYLNLRFDDVDETTTSSFTEEMASNIWQFTQKNADKKAFFIHCTMGKCRSGAIAEVLSDHFKVPYEEFKYDNPQVQPNILVKSLLRQKFQ